MIEITLEKCARYGVHPCQNIIEESIIVRPSFADMDLMDGFMDGWTDGPAITGKARNSDVRTSPER